MKKDFLHQDITHHMVGALAVFGLVVSSLVTTAGIAVLGVDAQVAFISQVNASTQTAAVHFADIPHSTSTNNMATSTMPMATDPHSSSTPPFCPQLSKTIIRGNKDATTTGDITKLQRFLTARYNLEASSTVTGYFGSSTEAYLKKFQQEQGIDPAGSVGPLTRALIAKLCAPGLNKLIDAKQASSTHEGGSDKDNNHSASSASPFKPGDDHRMGSTSTMGGGNHEGMPMASGTMPIKPHFEDGTSTHPMPPMSPTTHHEPPHASSTVSPGVSMQNFEGSSNAANVISAVAEIGDGLAKLGSATLSLIGL